MNQTKSLPFVISIDPAGAREIDDAIGVIRTETGWMLDVCIPDVPSLLKFGSEEDREASERGMTTYAANHVRQAMLPSSMVEQLSLSRAEDRPMIHVRIKIQGDLTAEVISIDRITHRTGAQLSYAEADNMLENGVSWYHSMLETLWDLTVRLQQERSATTGAVFDLKQGMITDEEGNIVRLDTERKHKSNLIVMEMMILANQALARYARERHRRVLYRNHVLEGFDRGDRRSAAIEFARRERIGRTVALQQIKSLQTLVRQAELGIESKGHYGLDSFDYAWFTSPLRRYVDVHNLRAVLSQSGNGDASDHETEWDKLEAMASRLTGLYRQKTSESADFHAKRSRKQIIDAINTRSNERLLDKSDVHTIIRALEENPGFDRLAAWDYIQTRMNRDDLSGKDMNLLIEKAAMLFGSKGKSVVEEWMEKDTRKAILDTFREGKGSTERNELINHFDQPENKDVNYKGKLLELAATRKARVVFLKPQRSGPAHAPMFSVEATWTGKQELKVQQTGRNVKAAEQAAAAELLGKIGPDEERTPATQNENLHPKNVLLEIAARDSRIQVKFHEAQMQGPPHDPTFTVRLELFGNGPAMQANGSGKSKKEAEKVAAEMALRLLSGNTNPYRKRRAGFFEEEDER